MGSGISFSGFNDIDFNVILNAIMTQESRPLTELQTRQRTLQATDTAYTQLATKLDALRSAASNLSSSSSLVTYSASSSDAAALTASAGSGATPGRYEVVVRELARAQVTVSESSAADTNTTVVATGGTLTIGGATITLAGPSTLTNVAAAINAESASPASASIVQTMPGEYRLVLSGKDTGAANNFTIATAGLGAGSALAFTDTDGNQISGDSTADNTVQAANAELTINGLAVVSASNTVDSAIAGVTLDLLAKDAQKTVVVNVGRNDTAILDKVDSFAAAYNDLVKFATDQTAAAAKGSTGTLGRDTVLRTVRNSLRSALSDAFGSGTYTTLSQVGIEFDKTGKLTVNRGTLGSALSANPSAVQSLFADSSSGAFKSVSGILDEYTRAGGFVPSARTRLSDEMRRLSQRTDDLSARLAIRRSALQKEFIAADSAMSRLNAQKSALQGFATSLNSLF